mmetsp:Transcript_25333/g.48512  ORF Transcript_25333/g.48512 Transcript_25333/m.48512 type:complete len:120 (+) Transcript_25333:81-440(+)
MSCERQSGKPKTEEGDSKSKVEVAKANGYATETIKPTSWIRQLSDASTAASEEGSSDEGSGKLVSTNTGVFDWMTRVETGLNPGSFGPSKGDLPAKCILPEARQLETLPEILELPTAAF